MDLILFWVFFYSTDIVQSLSAIKTKLYSTRMDYTVEGNAISGVKKVRSKIECAVVCEQDADCLTFSYEASSKLCYMSSQVNDAVANREYGPAKLSVWLDGEDTTGDDKLLSWKGVEIPYVEWAEFQPDGGKEDCILSSSIHDYYVKDMECTIDTREYICQIGDGLH